MSQTYSISARRRYGVERVCRVWVVARATMYDRRRRLQVEPTAVRRRGPPGAHSDEQIGLAIEGLIAASPFHGEGYRKMWARLRCQKQMRTSRERVRRVMRERGLQAPHRQGRRQPWEHRGTITTDRPDQMWGTDMTLTLTTDEGKANVFVASTIAPASASASTPRAGLPATSLWSRSAKEYVNTSAVSSRASPRGWPCVMTTAPPTWRGTSRPN